MRMRLRALHGHAENALPQFRLARQVTKARLVSPHHFGSTDAIIYLTLPTGSCDPERPRWIDRNVRYRLLVDAAAAPRRATRSSASKRSASASSSSSQTAASYASSASRTQARAEARARRGDSHDRRDW
jgi:hypothetical protein